MSKNIQSSLIRYNGDIGPTILDVDDKTDGPDGTTKPLTKEMLQQMIVANFPELQNVKDADVKTELELIKQQQLEILQRLNQPIDTRLSGSSVEDGLSVKQVDKLEVIVRLNNVEVGAGQSVMGYSDTVAERLDFTELRYNLIWSDGINWRLRCIPRITDSSDLAGSEITIDEAGSRSSGILIDRVDFTRYSFILHNDNEEDVTLEQIEILGVRA